MAPVRDSTTVRRGRVLVEEDGGVGRGRWWRKAMVEMMEWVLVEEGGSVGGGGW